MAGRSVNRVILMGHLGKDAEAKFTPSGVSVARFSLATNRRSKSKEKDGEWTEATDWHNIVLWRAENLVPYLTKGKQVLVEGHLEYRSWEDPEGGKHHATDIVSDNLVLISVGGEPKPETKADKPVKAPDPMEIGDDDVPF